MGVPRTLTGEKPFQMSRFMLSTLPHQKNRKKYFPRDLYYQCSLRLRNNQILPCKKIIPLIDMAY